MENANRDFGENILLSFILKVPSETMQKQQGLGNTEMDKTALEGFFPQIYHLQVWYPKFFAQQESLQLFSGNVCGRHRVQSCEMMQD